MRQLSIAVFALLGMSGAAFAQEAVFETKSQTPETALVAGRAALEYPARPVAKQTRFALKQESRPSPMRSSFNPLLKRWTLEHANQRGTP
ncbi:MAG: hypothetical protein WA635_02465 [Gallionella sp.]